MRTRLTLVRRGVGVTAAALILSACGGQAEEPSARDSATPTTPATSAVTPSDQASYSLEDREGFLATGPSCEELKGWYEQFPADTDGLTALRYIEACSEAPAPVLNHDIYPGENERLLEALLAPNVTGESRATAHWAIAKGVCEMFSGGQKSLWLVGSDVRDYGGTPQDYAAVVDTAVDECPSNADDLTLFGTKDVLGTTTDYIATLRKSGADLSGFGPDPDDQVAALAGVACTTVRDGDEDNAFFFSLMLDVNETEGQRLADAALAAYCPQFA